MERSQTYCTNCGAGIGESDKFCPKCGNSVTGIADREVEEKEVYSFGPMGVRICFSPEHVRADNQEHDEDCTDQSEDLWFSKGELDSNEASTIQGLSTVPGLIR